MDMTSSFLIKAAGRRLYKESIKPLESLYLMCSSVARLAWQKHIRFRLHGKEYDVTKTNITWFCLWKGNFNAGQLDTILAELGELKTLIEENLVSIGILFLKIVVPWIFIKVAMTPGNLVAVVTKSLDDARSGLSLSDNTEDLRISDAEYAAIANVYGYLNSSFEQLMDLTPAFEREVQFLEYCGELGIDSQPDSRKELLSDAGINSTGSNPQVSQYTDGSHGKLPIDTKHPQNSVVKFERRYTDHGADSDGLGQRTLIQKDRPKSNPYIPVQLVDLTPTDQEPPRHAQKAHDIVSEPETAPAESTVGPKLYSSILAIPKPSKAQNNSSSNDERTKEPPCRGTTLGDWAKFKKERTKLLRDFIENKSNSGESTNVSSSSSRMGRKRGETMENFLPQTGPATPRHHRMQYVKKWANRDPVMPAASPNEPSPLLSNPSTSSSKGTAAQATSGTDGEVAMNKIIDRAQPSLALTYSGWWGDSFEIHRLCPGFYSDGPSFGDGQYFCPKCQERFTERADLITHLETHNPSKGWSCPKCSDIMLGKDNMMLHLEVAHRGHLDGDVPTQIERVQVFPNRCLVCAKRQTSWEEWVRHHISVHCEEGEREHREHREHREPSKSATKSKALQRSASAEAPPTQQSAKWGKE